MCIVSASINNGKELLVWYNRYVHGVAAAMSNNMHIIIFMGYVVIRHYDIRFSLSFSSSLNSIHTYTKNNDGIFVIIKWYGSVRCRLRISSAQFLYFLWKNHQKKCGHIVKLFVLTTRRCIYNH